MKTIYNATSILVFLIILPSVFSQNQFQLTIGGPMNEQARHIIQTTDGGFAVAGWTASFGAYYLDAYIVKLSANGTLQWSMTIGSGSVDGFNYIVQTTDGGYVAAGNAFGALYFVKLDANGLFQWNKTINTIDGSFAHSIIQTTDGGFAAGGLYYDPKTDDYDISIVKVDSNINPQWNRTIGGAYGEIGNSIIQTTDGGYAVAGTTGSFGTGNADMYVIKLDAGGTLQWNRTIGGGAEEDASSIIQTTDGGYVAAGYTFSFGAGQSDIYIVKLDAQGTLQWSKTIGGPGFEYFRSFIQTSDGAFVVAGHSLSNFYIAKLSISNTLFWSITIGGAGDDRHPSLIQTSDGEYVAAGYTTSFGAGQSDIYIVKLNSNGNTCGNLSSHQSTLGTGGTTTSPIPNVNMRPTTVTTPTPATNTGGSIASVCFVGIQPASNEIPEKFVLYQNYPNPFNPITHFEFQIADFGLAKLQIFDALGREIAVLVNEELPPGTYEMDWNASNFPSGVYFYRLSAGNFKDTKRMVLIK